MLIGKTGISLLRYLVYLFRRNNDMKLRDAELLDIINEEFSLDKDHAWLNARRHGYNAGTLSVQREAPKVKCKQWIITDDGDRVAKTSRRRRIKIVNNKDLFDQYELTERLTTGSLYCPMKKSRLAIQKCIMYQLQDSHHPRCCCPSAATREELRKVLVLSTSDTSLVEDEL